jgi:hypothetical protein
VLRETPVATVGRVGSSDQEVGIDYTILRPNNFYQKDHGLKDVLSITSCIRSRCRPD